MARNETIIQLFLASPSDVNEEREIVRKVIDELNLTWRSKIGRSIELVRWESHAVPGLGTDPQAVINDRIPADYDIFLGVMWTRFGTPTNRAGSGTVEEFEIAKTRLKTEGQDSPRILMYFKNEGPDLDRLDPDQFKKVTDFRNSIGDEGTFYWKFRSTEDFETLVRVHLSRIVQSWSEESNNLSQVAAKRAEAYSPLPLDEFDVEGEDEEEGFLDLILDGSEDMEESTKSLSSITKALEDVGTAMNQRTHEFKEIGNFESTKSVREAKRVSNTAAQNMIEFVRRLRTETPILSDRYRSGIRRMAKVISYAKEFGDKNEDSINDLRQSLCTNRDTIFNIMPSIEGFRNSIKALPRVTSRFNKARRASIREVDILLQELKKCSTLINEAIKAIDEYLQTGSVQ